MISKSLSCEFVHLWWEFSIISYVYLETPSSKPKPHDAGVSAAHKKFVEVVTGSAASLVAEPVLKKPLGPGLDRQPKSANAEGGGFDVWW